MKGPSGKAMPTIYLRPRPGLTMNNAKQSRRNCWSGGPTTAVDLRFQGGLGCTRRMDRGGATITGVT